MHSFKISNDVDLIIESNTVPSVDVLSQSNSKNEMFSSSVQGPAELTDLKHRSETLDRLRRSDVPETTMVNAAENQVVKADEEGFLNGFGLFIGLKLIKRTEFQLLMWYEQVVILNFMKMRKIWLECLMFLLFMHGLILLLDAVKKRIVCNSKPAAGICSRCGAGARVADMKTATRFCYVPFYSKTWRAVICSLCGAILRSYR